jgi:hypothetical protein
MSKIQIVILSGAGVILFMTYLLVGLLSKINESSSADHSNAMDDLE